MKKLLVLVLTLTALAAAGWLSWSWRQQQQSAGSAPSAPSWRVVIDESYNSALSDYRQRWDTLAQAHESGAFAARAWPHVSLLREPRAPMRLDAWPAATTHPQPRWLQLLLVSAVEYYQQVSSSGNLNPRSRVAAAFGRMDISRQRLTLSVGQLALNGAEHRVVSAGFPWTPEDSSTPLRLELDGDRLTLSLGPRQVSTLADRVLPGADEYMRAGLSGERVQITRLRWESAQASPSEALLAQADKYLAFGRTEQSLPILDELLTLSPSARVSMRKATVLGLQGQDAEALTIYRQLMEPGGDSFYAGYAAVARAQLEKRAGRPGLEMERALGSWTTPYRGHPALDQARLLRAQWMGEALGNGTAFQQLIRQVLVGRDPAAARSALALLSEGPLALPSAELMPLLQEALAEGNDLGQALYEAISLKQAALQSSTGQWDALLRTAMDARTKSYGVRTAIYQELSKSLETGPAPKVKALLQKAADDGPFLRDYLLNSGYPLARHPSRRPPRPVAQETARDLLQTRVSLGPGPAKPGTKLSFFEPSSASAKSYGHQPQAPAERRNDALCLDFNSGDYWGCGVALHPNLGKLRQGGASDLSGARRLQARVRAPKGIEYFFMLSESGVGPVSADSHQGEAGADGEQYLLPVQIGTGAWQDLDLPLGQATPVLAWGNLEGNFTLDLQAIQKLDLAIPGKQGSGEICVKDMRFSGR